MDPLIATWAGVFQPVATLIAAAVAALAAIVTLILTLSAARRAEMRVSQRESLLPYLEELSELTHACVATPSSLRRQSVAGASLGSWFSRSLIAGEGLKKLRLKVRYILIGLDEAIRTLSLVPSRFTHIRAEVGHRPERLLRAADLLRARIDEAIRYTFRTGLQPRRWHIWRATRAAARVNRIFQEARP